MESQKNHKGIWGTLLVFITGAILVAAFLLYASPSEAKPSVEWSPKSITQEIDAGASTTITASFKASKELTDVVVRVVPEIAPYVSTDPIAFGDIAKGETRDLEITISAPADATPGTIEGTIQLRRGSGPKKTYAKPLPVTITVVAIENEGQVSNGDVTVTFSVFDNWKYSPVGERGYLYSPESINALNSGDLETPPDITIAILEKQTSLDLDNFISSYKNGWYDGYTERARISISEHEAVVLDDTTTMPPSFPRRAAFIDVGNSIVLITEHYNNEQEFNDLLDSVVISSGGV